MLHDDIYNTLKYTDNKPSGIKSALHHEDMIESPPVGIYFDETLKKNAELAATAKEFFDKGLITVPFDNCLFICQCYWDEILKTDNFSFSGELILNLHKRDNILTITHLAKILNEKAFDVKNVIGIIDIEKHTYQVDSLINKNVSDDEMKSYAMIVNSALIMLMMLNHPAYEQEEHDAGKWLNAKREKKGKPIKSKYIYVNMKPHIKAALTDGTGRVVCPHWRRGHVRRLHDGRIVPVQACLVNWEGVPEEIQKKVYVV